MVTFSIPGEGDNAEAGRSTPRPVPSLPFASRAGYVPSPIRNNKRLGTPQSVPSRKHLLTRDALPTSSLSRSQIASNRNIFRQSSITNSPPHMPFSPSLSQSTATKVFAPGATPEPSRVYRESTAKATPRGMASRATDKELFKLRIEDPDPELSGEVLTNKIPKQWSSSSSIYADQYLKHLCPPDFDDEQRRQFFCILDLRRLKYAANDIFSRKDWKLNVINFAKEFEKSRSIILLRYGLYEFQNIKPSKDIIKRWRREHGLPDPEEEDVEATPTKASSKKRKAEGDEIPKDSGLATNNNKRRATVQDEEEEEATPVAAPAAKKNKRKASLSDEAETQPSKMQKATPSASKSLFEKITNNKSSTPAGSPLKNFTKPAEESTTPKVNPFTANKANGTSLSRSVFQTLKPASAQAGGNIFGYLSDASSAKNSVADDDGEGSDSDAEGSEEPSAVASAAETASQVDSNAPFGQSTAANAGAGESSAPGTRESTPGRSLFDRVTKNSAGEPLRMDEPAEESSPERPEAKPLDQTWNPSTSLKFAPPTSAPQSNSLFANSTSTPATNIFGTKTSTSSNIFGAKQDKPAEKETPATTVDFKDKSGSESDKENENDEAPKKSLFESKAPALQPNTTFFPLKSASETPKPAEPAKSLFGAPKQDVKPAEPAEPKANGLSTEPAKSLFGASTPAEKPAPVTNLFGSSKPAASSTPVLQSSTLFGGKPAEAPKPATSLFGASSTPASGASTPAPATSLFGAKPATTATTNIFGGASTTPAVTPTTKSLFGGSSEAPKADAASASAGFSFTSTGSNEAAKPLFAAPKSPTASAPMFGGSPMKQDGPSPAKKAFNGGSGATTSAPPSIFNFGVGNTSSSSAPPIFSGASAAPTNGASSFGAASTNSGSGGSFSFGAGNSFNNPFASGSGNVDKANAGSNSNSGGMFNFGGTSAPSTTSTFQFGGASTSSAPAPVFGANSGSAPSFGSTTSAGTAPTFSFGAGTSQAPSSAPSFGTQAAPNMFNLQPPAGGASTGTNTPFSLGGGSSLATTPAGGTPEPSTTAQATTKATEDEGEKQEQISLTEGAEKDEDVLHEVRAKVLKFVSASDKEKKDEKKSKSPWTTQGVGHLRLLKHKETEAVRLLMRAEPRGNVALNRSVLPNMTYKADEKYVKLTTSNETGDGLETWMIQVKTKDLAKELAEGLEKHKELNNKK